MRGSDVQRLVALVDDDATDPALTRTTLDRLLTDAPADGVPLALDLLARPPRYKPSRGLLVDPGDATFRRWQRRIAAAAALLSAPAGAGVWSELLAELTECRDLATDALAEARPSPALPAEAAGLVRRLAGPRTPTA